jgi:23S rRNA pseudouridine1911/1915/1917 synthase
VRAPVRESRVQHLFDVISEDDEILVINKPAGLVCHPTKGDVYSSLISRARLYLGAENPPHMINRLDRETSGIVIVAKTPDANTTLRKLWESRAVEKEYLTIVHGEMKGPRLIDAPIGADESSLVSIKDRVRSDGSPSRTQVFPVRNFARNRRTFTLARVVLFTGRKHQIRIHLSHIGHPIVGDKLYGGDEQLYLSFVKGELTEEQRERLMTANHCLHARQVTFELFGRTRSYIAAPEPFFTEFADNKTARRGGPF